MDDFSRVILGWDVKADMAGRSLEDVIQQAVDFTGMTDVLLEDRMGLLTDNGAGYISQQFNEYLRLVGIRHITAAPFHPQTNGKFERYHRTLKGEINHVPYEMPSELKEAIRDFVNYYFSLTTYISKHLCSLFHPYGCLVFGYICVVMLCHNKGNQISPNLPFLSLLTSIFTIIKIELILKQ